MRTRSCELVEDLNRYARACVESYGTNPPGGDKSGQNSRSAGALRDVDDSSTNRIGTRRVGVLALVALLVASVVAPSLAPVAAASNASTPEMPPGFVGLPDSNVQQGTPTSSAFPYRASNLTGGDVLASSHAATTKFIITTPDAAQTDLGPNATVSEGLGNLAIVIRDDSAHAGRKIAIRAEEVRDALGYLPNRVRGVHEDGGTWNEPVSPSSGYIVVEIPHFSDNVITFSGAVELSGDPAATGASYNYDLAEFDAATPPKVTFTGVEVTAWDNVSASGLGNGATLATDVAGTAAPRGPGGAPQVVLVGRTQTSSRTASGSVAPSGSDSFSQVGGNLGPTSPSLTLTSTSESKIRENDGTYLYDDEIHTFDNPPASVGRIRVRIKNTVQEHESLGDISVRVDGGTWQTIESSGPEIYSSGRTLSYDVDVDPSNSLEVKITGNNLDEDLVWEWVELTGSGPDSVTVTTSSGKTATFGEFGTGESKSSSIDLKTGDSSLDFSSSGGDANASLDWSLEFTERTQTEDPKIDIDGDGQNEASHSGTLADGEMRTFAVDLSVGDDTATISTAGGSSVDVGVKLKEVTETTDPAVEVNGHWRNLSGPLATGEMWNLTLNQSHLREGMNRVNVSVGSPSADAPTGAVGLSYSHDAHDDQSVSYAGETWSERYNVSRTYGDAATNATLTVPFASNVISVRDTTVYLNSTETAPAHTEFSNTTLTVGLGNLQPGTTARVVVNGSKVAAENGAIQVTNPTTAGNALNSTFEVVSRSDGFRLDVSGTASGDWVHYVANPSWQNMSASARIADGGASQYLRLPNAPAGGTATARTLDLKTSPQNDVVVEVEDASDPRFAVSPGKTAGDSVTFDYYDTQSGVEYQLISSTFERQEDSAVAESPVSLALDSDSPNTLYIQAENSTSSGGGGSGGGGGVPPLGETARSVAEDPLANPILVLGAGTIVILGAGLLARRRGVPVWATGGVLGLVFVVALESLAPGYLSGALAGVLAQLGTGLGSVSSALWLAGGGLALWGAYRTVKKFTRKQNVTLRLRGGN